MRKLCLHFGECGGCKWQDIDYKNQLKLKMQSLVELLKKYNLTYKDKDLKNIIPSPEIWNYRNKMEYTFYALEEGGLLCGLHRKERKNEIVELEECLISSKVSVDILKKTLEFARKFNLTAYHRYRHEGFLRHLVVREAKTTKEVMVNLVTTDSDKINKSTYLKYLKSAVKKPFKLKSVYHTINNRLSDTVAVDKEELIFGSKFIEEKINGLRFRIFSQSFFQTNSYGLELLYKKSKEMLKITKDKTVLDLFCGSGGLGLYLASSIKSVTGVEINEEAVKGAYLNAKINNLDNMNFYVLDVKEALRKHHSDWQDNFEIAVIDPPRAGLSKKVVERLIDINCPQILYTSCNPNSLFLNLTYLTESKYKIKEIQPIDMFAHTPHLETIVLLERN